MAALDTLIDRYLDDPTASWAVGTYGAVAEFHRDADESAHPLKPKGRATARGAVRIEALAGARGLAWEAGPGGGAPWTQGFAFCLPEADARLHARTALARDEETDEGTLFDLGLGVAHLDACVLADDALARSLAPHAGRSVWDEASRAFALIKEASPPRVFRTRLAEVRVNQRIGSASRGIPTPEGPHTHILPPLLHKGRAWSPEIPVPAGAVPILYLYPAHPVQDDLGRARPFDSVAFEAFQRLLADYGPAGYWERKRALDGAAGGADPRTARIALAQRRAQGRPAEELDRLARAWGIGAP